MQRIRTCIGCRAKSDKHELYRIVRSPEGAVDFDRSANAPGRGAYVCSRDCFEKVVGNGRLASALRMRISADVYDALAANPVWAESGAASGKE